MGGGAMPGYRLYFIDRFSGHIEHRREFLADDDPAAVAVAEGWSNGQAMELWQGARQVRCWDRQPRR